MNIVWKKNIHQAGRTLDIFPPSAVLRLFQVAMHTLHKHRRALPALLQFRNIVVRQCARVHQSAPNHSSEPKRIPKVLSWNTRVCGDIRLIWEKGLQTLHSNIYLSTFGNLALSTFCCENCKLMARQNTQRLRGCWVAKPPQMPPASPLTSRHHRGSRSHRHGHGGGHGHSDGHGFTSPGGRCCHRCSCSWCAVLLSTAAALQRQGGNQAQANGRERTDKLHDHKG